MIRVYDHGGYQAYVLDNQFVVCTDPTKSTTISTGLAVDQICDVLAERGFPISPAPYHTLPPLYDPITKQRIPKANLTHSHYVRYENKIYKFYTFNPIQVPRPLSINTTGEFFLIKLPHKLYGPTFYVNRSDKELYHRVGEKLKAVNRLLKAHATITNREINRSMAGATLVWHKDQTPFRDVLSALVYNDVSAQETALQLIELESEYDNYSIRKYVPLYDVRQVLSFLELHGYQKVPFLEVVNYEN